MFHAVAVQKLAEWQRLKALVLNSVSSRITRQVYNMALDKFMALFRLVPRPSFTKNCLVHSSSRYTGISSSGRGP
jgi:hypothetical protein